jgi:hypothetical protein
MQRFNLSQCERRYTVCEENNESRACQFRSGVNGDEGTAVNNRLPPDTWRPVNERMNTRITRITRINETPWSKSRYQEFCLALPS